MSEPTQEQPTGSDQDYQYFEERAGSVTYQKTLTAKCRTFDTTARADIESQEPVVVCQPFNPETAQPSNYAQTAQRLPNLEYEDKVFSSFVVGWTTETGKTCLVNPVQLGDLTQDTVTMTDTIFPVFVMGTDHLPVRAQVLDRDIHDYEPGTYLVLTDYPGMGSLTVQVGVQKSESEQTYDVNTYKAELELYLIYMNWDEQNQAYWKDYFKVGNVDRILDKDNAAYGIFGMYAGGPLPPVSSQRAEKPRICWDQPRSGGSNNFGLQSMESGFRADTDCQREGRRVGYYCSRDALLSVRETKFLSARVEDTRKSVSDYSSLLKEYCFVICDGFNSWALNTRGAETTNIPFKDIDNEDLGPIIVIVQEGVSTLRIRENPQMPECRQSLFQNENMVQPPICINWKRFQNDFNLTGPTGHNVEAGAGGVSGQVARSATGIQQIMRLQDINDYLVFPINIRNSKDYPWQTEPEYREYIFSLKQEPNWFPEQRRYDEYWHVFSRLSDMNGPPESSIYCYLGTISNSHNPGSGALNYRKTFFQRSPFPSDINQSLYPNITAEDRTRARQMTQEWQKIMQNREFRAIVQNLAKVDINDINNVTINSQTRQLRQQSLLGYNSQFV